MRSIDTKWRQRTRKLRGKFLGYSGVTEEQVSVKKKVKATERDRWLEGMQTKKALEGYRLNKTVIAKESIYDNSRGSSLLFEARTGVLRTRTYRAKYQEMDTVCAACGEEDETAEHLILYCKGLHPVHTEDNIDLIRSLGFRDSEGKVDFKTVEITKQRLSECSTDLRCTAPLGRGAEDVADTSPTPYPLVGPRPRRYRFAVHADGNMSAEKMSEMKDLDLKRALKSRGLPTSGNKGELIERLQATACSPTDTIRDIHCSPEFLSNTTVSDEDEVFPPESLDIPTAGNNGSEVAMDCTDEPSAAGETSTPTLLPTTRFLPVNTMSNSVQHLVSSEPQVSRHCQPKETTLVDVHAACTATNRPADEPSQGATPTTAPRAATPVLTPDSARTVTVKSTDIAAAAEDSAAAVDDTTNIVDCGSLELMADAKHDDTNQRYPLECKVCDEMYKTRDAHEKRLEELEAAYRRHVSTPRPSIGRAQAV
ncbi:hypothetical protein HPB47_020163 [Ixodes persulcatus]|uniref:Uncharacterized protein n=1 Tax=Ixodes persulcatus TaxID=34615 RepID=A0AC60QG56_IXOPE|nr:hypothetical protein HPB47_020163 [Ixodes persulcatus]